LFVLAVGLAVLAVLVLLVIDLSQHKDAIRRNYPVIGRFRYLFSSLGEFFRQYFFAMDREEMPFNRAQRDWVERSSAGLDNTVAFGSTQNITAVGSPIFASAIYAPLDSETTEPPALVIGPHARQPYEARSIINVSGMSYGALSAPAIQALSRGARMAGCWMNTGEGALSSFERLFVLFDRAAPEVCQVMRTDGEVIEHLFTVACALDSLVVGEAQILSQVKQAYERAGTFDATGPLLNTAFQSASRVAKRVQHETAIHRRRVSIPSIAVGEVAPEFFETLTDKRVLLIGAGEMGAETLRYLRDGGAKHITIVNRSADRALELARSLDAQVAPWESLEEQMASADLVVSTTGATEPIVTLERFRGVQTARYERLLLILDLAVPRDFDPAIGDLSGVYLYSVDDLQASADRNRREREREWPKAKQIIEHETSEYLTSLQSRATGPVIKKLRERAESVKTSELERLLKRLERAEDGPQQTAEIQQAFDRLVNKLLHPPLASLRNDAASGHRQGLVDALRRLFQLGD
jgi:glutamyl-tRNA reductase